MKKLSCIAVLVVVLISCSKDFEEGQPDLIIGTWEQSEFVEGENFSQSLRYNFNADHSFNLSRTIIDHSTSEILGYRYKSSGTFEINGNRLNINESELYTHNDSKGLYSDLDDLELSEVTNQRNVVFSINKEQNQLTFEHDPCGANENCIKFQSFQRLE